MSYQIYHQTVGVKIKLDPSALVYVHSLHALVSITPLQDFAVALSLLFTKQLSPVILSTLLISQRITLCCLSDKTIACSEAATDSC